MIDIKKSVVQAKSVLEKLTDNLHAFDQHIPSPNANLERLADFTQKNPILALGAAVAVGLWINRRRQRMHRTVELAVVLDRARKLIGILREIEGVVGLSHQYYVGRDCRH